MTAEEIQERLAEPFPADWVEWRPLVTSKDGQSALASAYIDARTVMDRLDAAVGAFNWQDAYELLAGGCVRCTLSIWMNDQWVRKQDVGAPSEQPDPHDKVKAAHSDALKRAAVKWGVGRYLYQIPGKWVPYDAQKKQLREIPKLPSWALPKQPNGRGPTDTGAVDDPAIDIWKKWLKDKESLTRENAMGILNECLPEIGDLADAAKRVVWPMVKGWAEKKGWSFNPETKTFVPNSQPTGASS